MLQAMCCACIMMKWQVVCWCSLMLGMSQVILGQDLFPDSERNVKEKVSGHKLLLLKYDQGSPGGAPWPSLVVLQVFGCNVTGEWHSELGSQLLLRAVAPEVRGVYRTAVESMRGAAGPNHEAKVVGVISDGPQPTIVFSVLWAKGDVFRNLFSDSPDPNNQLINSEVQIKPLSV